MGQFAVVLGSGFAHMAFDVDDLLEILELSIYLQNRDGVTIIGIWAIMHPDTGVGAGELGTAWYPIDC